MNYIFYPPGLGGSFRDFHFGFRARFRIHPSRKRPNRQVLQRTGSRQKSNAFCERAAAGRGPSPVAEAEARKLASTALITSPAINRTRNTIARVACCGNGRLGRRASESGTLCQRDTS